MKSEMHQRAFLSVRKLLQQVGYTDFVCIMMNFGKPHLNDENHFHGIHNFSAIIISDETVGIDIELQREQIYPYC
jgi:phosphopantetheinyl transferase